MSPRALRDHPQTQGRSSVTSTGALESRGNGTTPETVQIPRHVETLGGPGAVVAGPCLSVRGGRPELEVAGVPDGVPVVEQIFGVGRQEHGLTLVPGTDTAHAGVSDEVPAVRLVARGGETGVPGGRPGVVEGRVRVVVETRCAPALSASVLLVGVSPVAPVVDVGDGVVDGTWAVTAERRPTRGDDVREGLPVVGPVPLRRRPTPRDSGRPGLPRAPGPRSGGRTPTVLGKGHYK